MVELVEEKKNHLGSILKIQNYLLECSEIKSRIREKRKAIESTQYSSGDLGSVLSLQRRLSTIEAALVLLEPRLVELQQEGESLATTHPAQAMEVLMQFEEISEEWEALKKTLQGCEDSLTVASRSAGPVAGGQGMGLATGGQRECWNRRRPGRPILASHCPGLSLQAAAVHPGPGQLPDLAGEDPGSHGLTRGGAAGGPLGGRAAAAPPCSAQGGDQPL